MEIGTDRGRVDGWPARSNINHNPFQALLSNATEEHGWAVREFSPLRSLIARPDIWHWHWPEGQFAHRSRYAAWIRFCVLVLLLRAAKIRNIPIIWTAHNIGGHIVANRPVEDRFWRIFHKHVSGVHFLSEASRIQALKRFPILASKPYVVTRHGHYRDVYGEPPTRVDSRAACKLDEAKKTIVFCGKVSAYKGVGDLVRAFTKTVGTQIQLLIAGAATDEEAKLVQEAAGHDARIHFNLKLLSDAEIKATVGAADLIVLPYREVTNSGSALMALSLNRPLLTTDKGSMLELAVDVGAEWVTTYEGELTPGIIAAALEESANREGDEPNLEVFNWDRIGLQVASLYARVGS